MFEKYIEGLVVEYFSTWLEGFDKEGIRVALFSGKLCFTNLKFKKAALDALQLPIVLKEGRLGTLFVKVPWKRLSKESVHVVLEDLHLVLGPAHASDDGASLQDRQKWAKQQELRVRELLYAKDDAASLLSPKVSEKEDATKPKSGWKYKDKLISTILDNLTFELKRIHIRYEDMTMEISKNPIAFGISVDELKIATTNANGHVTFMDRSTSHTPFVHKSLELVQCYIYWDIMKSKDVSQMTYLVEPLSTSAKVTENHDVSSYNFIPQYRIRITTSDLVISVSPNQCKDITNVIDFFGEHEMYLQRSQCRKNRPTVPVVGNARVWWRYAYDSAVKLLIPQTTACSWKQCFYLMKFRDEYIPLYSRSLNSASWKAPLQKQEENTLQALEEDDKVSAETIVFFRLCAKEELGMERSRRKHIKEQVKTKSKWSMNNLLKKSNTPTPSPTSKDTPKLSLFSPTKKADMVVPPSPTSSSTASTPPSPIGKMQSLMVCLDPVERQLLYENVGKWFFDNDPIPAEQTVVPATSPRSKSPGIFVGLDFNMKSIELSVGKETLNDAKQTIKKQFIRFDMKGMSLAIQRHIRVGKEAIEQSFEFAIEHIELRDATVHEMNPLSVIFGSVPHHKTKSPLIRLKYDILPTMSSLTISIDPAQVLYNKVAIDKIQKYITPDVEKQSTKQASNNDDFTPKNPIQVSLHISRLEFAIAGANEKFILLHTTGISFTSSNIFKEFSCAVESVDLLLVPIDQLRLLMDDATLQYNCRILKRFQFQANGSLEDDPMKWKYHVQVSELTANLLVSQLRSLLLFNSHLSSTKSTGKPFTIPLDVQFESPNIQIRLVGNESLRSGLQLECAQIVVGISLETSGTICVHGQLQDLVCKEAQSTSTHRQYTFQDSVTNELLVIAQPTAITCLWASLSTPPVITLGVPHVDLMWNYHVIKEALQCFLAPIPIPSVVTSSDTFAQINVRVASTSIRFNPSGSTEFILRCSRIDALVQTYINSDIMMDLAFEDVILEVGALRLFSLPESSSLRYELSGAGALKLRDNAATYIEAIIAPGQIFYCHPQLLAFGTYCTSAMLELFTWLYLTREGLGRSAIPPEILRCKALCLCESMELLVPQRPGEDAEWVIRIEKIMVNSSRYGNSHYEKYHIDANVSMGSFLRAASSHIDFVTEITEEVTRIDCTAPHVALEIGRDQIHYLLSVLDNNIGAPAIPVDAIRSLVAPKTQNEKLQMQLNVPNFTLHLMDESKAFLLTTVEDLALSFNQFANSVMTFEINASSIACLSPAKEFQLDVLAQKESHAIKVGIEKSTNLQQSIEIAIDTMHLTPHVKTIIGTVEFFTSIKGLKSSSSDLDLTFKLVEYHLLMNSPTKSNLGLFGSIESSVKVVNKAPLVQIKAKDTILVLLSSSWPLCGAMPRIQDTLSLLIPDVGRALCPGFNFDVDISVTNSIQQVSAYVTDIHGVVSGVDMCTIYYTIMKYLMDFNECKPPRKISGVDLFINVVVNSASLTLVSPENESYAPMMRLYVYNMMVKESYKFTSTGSISSDLNLQFSDESEHQLSLNEGLSLWCFNASLGVWEPCIEPWSFRCANVITVEDDTMIIRASFQGSKSQKCHINLSLSTLKNICCVLRHFMDAKVEVDGDVTCGVYIHNNTSYAISYWSSDSDCRRPHEVPEQSKVPLQLAKQTFFPTDQTISLCWHDWQPLNDVRLHTAGQFVHTLMPKDKTDKKSMQVLLDVASLNGLRTLTISSIVRVCNDSDIALRVGCVVMADDGSTSIVEAGEIQPNAFMGMPMEICSTVGQAHLVFRPATSLLYEWSQPIVHQEDATNLIATCPLNSLIDVKRSKTCNCLPAFSSANPSPTSTKTVCSHCNFFFGVATKLIKPRNKNALSPYLAVHVFAPITLQNQCPVPIHVLVFTTKKAKTNETMQAKAPQLDEEIEPVQIHLVSSVSLQPNAIHHVYASSLQYKTYASIALVHQKWTPLKSLNVIDKENAIWAVEDATQRNHYVHWALTEGMHNQKQALIYPGYVIYDQTQLDLQYDVDTSRFYSKKSFGLINFSSGNKGNLSASDSLETDVIQASLQALSKLPLSNVEDWTADIIPYMLSGATDVSIRIDRIKSLRTSTSSVRLDAISESVQNSHRLFSDQSKEWHDIGVLVRRTDHRTKIVTFVPRYMVLNKTPYTLLLCPSALLKDKDLLRLPTAASSQPSATTPGITGSRRYDSSVDTFQAFHWSTMNDPSDYCVRIKPADASGWKWSGKFSIHDVGETAINSVNRVTSEIHIIRVQIRVYQGTQVYIVMSLEEQTPLYRIINRSEEVVHFHQLLESDDKSPMIRRLLPNEDLCFGWDEPYFVDVRKLSLCFQNTIKCHVEIDHIHDEVTHVELSSKKVFLQIYLDGTTKVLYINDTEPMQREQLMRISSKSSHGSNTRYIVDCNLPQVVVSVVDSSPAELLVLTLQNMTVIGGLTPEDNEIELTIDRVQIDNQLSTAAFPVIFAPSNISTEDEANTQPFFHLSLIRLFYSPDIEFFKYLSALMQPATMQLDVSVLLSIARLVTDCIELVDFYFPNWRVQDYTSAFVEKLHAQREPRVYFETLQLHPIKLCVTFTQSALNSQAKQTVMARVPLMFHVLQTNLANIDNASLHLNALHIFHSFSSISMLVSSVRQHYTTQCLRQVYSLIGSAEILGNPLGLVSNLGSGVKDFFYEPAAGMVQGPGQFVKGLSRGTESLVKNSVYGTFNAASKLTGSISTGLVNLSMDKSYIQARTNRKITQGPTNVGAGILLGTKQLGQGIFAGVSGVITKPVLGAYHNGLTGFVEGVGKGIIGAAVKPTAGILDLAAQTTAGITYSAATHDKKPRLHRLRLPRMMATSDKRLTIFSDETATIATLLSNLPKDSIASDEQHEMHVLLPNNRIILATSHQLMALDMSSITKPRLLWAYPVRHVLNSVSNSDGVNISIQAESVIVVKVALEANQDCERDRVEELICRVVSQNNLANHIRSYEVM
ncbi:vacuolar protein sorting-associated protein [Thraustotheca clavata]|uniref:Vacuolar protein sorting-associated protein n=1 Tax=Thraustotheca clavata TaxID=74557 RepID=A0A1V9ZNN4_9STRA|nr:vacuolar protein sorting-associated protein [Thraustotheca clavata]